MLLYTLYIFITDPRIPSNPSPTKYRDSSNKECEFRLNQKIQDEAWMDGYTEPEQALLELIQYNDSNNEECEFRLIQEIQGECSALGTRFKINQGTLKGIERAHGK